jgi:hypothetical protein
MSAFGGKAVIEWCCEESPLLTQSGTRDAWTPGLRESFPPVNCIAQKSRRFVIPGGEELAGTTARRGRF